MRDRTLWTLHVAAGVVILFALGLHMAIMHLDATLGLFGAAGAHPIDWASVVARTRDVAFTVVYVVLLGTALFHGLYGLRNILRELGPGPRAARALDASLSAFGAALFLFGAWAAVQGQAVARAASATMGR